MQSVRRHSVSGLSPPLQVMQSKGFGLAQCLRGTGISPSDLQDHHQTVTFDQEMQFYRNALELSRDPTIGILFGAAYEPQRFGICSFAAFSAATFRQALEIVCEYIDLTFSWFDATLQIGTSDTVLEFHPRYGMEENLMNLFYDRDIAGTLVFFNKVLDRRAPLKSVLLPHSGHGKKQVYRDYLSCDITFNTESAPCLKFASNMLDHALPLSDPRATEQMLQQCETLRSRISVNHGYADDVRRLILSSPNITTNIDRLADQLCICSRTLRRHLNKEGTSYREILDDVRRNLAIEYLQHTQLSLDDISVLLGYSEAGNFTHAFKRWCGASPSEFRTCAQAAAP